MYELYSLTCQLDTHVLNRMINKLISYGFLKILQMLLNNKTGGIDERNKKKPIAIIFSF